MSKRKSTKTTTTDTAIETRPASLAIADKGIRTGHDFANLMSALMSDLIGGRVTPSIGNATCNAGGKLLKVVEMQYRYGTKGPGLADKTLVLALECPAEEREAVAASAPAAVSPRR